MIATLNAIYESGHLRLLEPVTLPENSRVRVQVEVVNDAERTEWLAQSERVLTKVWDNDADDVYNELLAP